MTEAPVTPERLMFVLDHLWDRGKSEMVLLGLDKPAAFARFMGYARNGRKARVLEADGVPVVAVGGASEPDEQTDFTWFVATNEFEKHARAITRYIRAETKAYPGPLCIYSVCLHPDTAKWFRVLGYAPTDYAKRLPSGATLHKFERA